MRRYYLRFMDPRNANALVDPEKERYNSYPFGCNDQHGGLTDLNFLWTKILKFPCP